MPIPDEAANVQVAFLPPMSGLASNETRLDPGAINVRVGEGRTADVLRNLCYAICEQSTDEWTTLAQHIKGLFGAELEPPEYIAERGEIVMSYRERSVRLDLSSSGRGLQQTLLLLAYMYANRGSILLLDEPDAHLEILRQRQIYQLIVDVARQHGNQVIAASHSEVLLNEAADRDVVVAFVGSPHRINDRGSQVLKSLREIGFEDYYQAQITGWVLYLEGATDLAILQAFAKTLHHEEALKALDRPFVRYVGNQPVEVLKHFYGLREAVPGLKAIAIFDRLERPFPEGLGDIGHQWKRKEIENYVCCREALDTYVTETAWKETDLELLASAESEKRLKAMRRSIQEVEEALDTLGKGSPWGAEIKASDEFLVPVFQKYFKYLNLPNIMEKRNFHELARFVPVDKLDPELREKLDAIARTAHRDAAEEES